MRGRSPGRGQAVTQSRSPIVSSAASTPLGRLGGIDSPDARQILGQKLDLSVRGPLEKKSSSSRSSGPGLWRLARNGARAGPGVDAAPALK
jgi:hypothetical protein